MTPKVTELTSRQNFRALFSSPCKLRPRGNWYLTHNTLRFCIYKMAANDEEESMSGNVANTVMSARIKSSLNKLWN